MLKFKESIKNNTVIFTAKKNNFKYQIKENSKEIFCVIWDLKKMLPITQSGIILNLII